MKKNGNGKPPSPWQGVFESVQRMARDVAAAGHDLGVEEIGFLVDSYYRVQERRMQEANQVRDLWKGEKPHSVILWLHEQSRVLEQQVKRAFSAFVMANDLGVWAISQVGIGEVLAAGLLANIDLHKAPVPNSIFRFAGLDPSIKWHGSKVAKELIRGIRDSGTEGDLGALLSISEAANYSPSRLLSEATGNLTPDRQAVVAVLSRIMGEDVENVATTIAERPYQIDEAIRHTIGAGGDLPIPPQQVTHTVYDALFLSGAEGLPKGEIDFKKVEKALARRPWNTSLKRICWLIGESFIKTQNHEESFYGPLLKARLEYEWDNNVAGRYADQAAQNLSRVKKSTESHRWCSGALTAKQAEIYRSLPNERRLGWAEKNCGAAGSGVPMLSPAHIKTRAARQVVKIFLTHYWEVGRKIEGLPVPNLWITEFGGHGHKIEPPLSRDARVNKILQGK